MPGPTHPSYRMLTTNFWTEQLRWRSCFQFSSAVGWTGQG
jgi:hypothetical protein